MDGANDALFNAAPAGDGTKYHSHDNGITRTQKRIIKLKVNPLIKNTSTSKFITLKQN